MKILIVGGDRRMIAAYEILKEKHEVSTLGLLDGDDGKIEDAEAVVLPVPTTRDNKTVNCPLTNKIIPLDLIKNAPRGSTVFTNGYNTGHYPQFDYSKSEAFCIKNAVATAEGAISEAITKTDFTLFGSKILIIGYGRIGKILLSRLKSFGADITVSARKESDFAFLKAQGINYTETAKTSETVQNYDIIFNTVDVALFSDLSGFSKTFLFDLSSKGCLDYGLNKDADLKIFKLPGIPGRTAPQSAGKIIAETVENALNTTQKY